MVNWDDAAQKNLLLTVIHLLGVATPKWDDVATAMGTGYTASAVKQQFNKLRNDAKKQFGESGAAASTPKNPGKRGGNMAEGEMSKSTGKRKAKEIVDEDDAIGEDAPESPTKKEKLEPVDDEL